MNFAQRQRDPRRHLVGIGAVILFHAFVVYALVTGLAKKVVEVVRAPIETKVIEEIKKPPPPQEIVVPPPPKLEAPPPAPVVIAPAPPPVVVAAPPAPPAPAVVSAAVACSNYRQKMGDASFPREAARAGLEKGEVLMQFTLGAGGEIKNVKAVRASHPIFARAAQKIVEEYSCQGQGHEVVVQVPFSYKME
jgi:periplasmic protein TonB